MKMAFILENSAPAIQVESQLLSVPVSYTDRWRTENERIYPTSALTEEGTAEDIIFFIPPSSSGGLSLANRLPGSRSGHKKTSVRLRSVEFY